MPKLVVGIDLGATNIRAALGSFEKGILRIVKAGTPSAGSADDLIERLKFIVREAAAERVEKISAIGVGSMGTIDIRRGILLGAANANFKNVEIVKRLSEEFGVPTYILNDCTVAALGEKVFGAAKDSENFAYVGFGTGIGGGVFVDGELLLGKDGNAVEIGHMVIDMNEKLPCGCGSRGHWESYCSGRNIPLFAKTWISSKGRRYGKSILTNYREDELTAKLIFDAAKMGDKLALDLIDEVGRLNAIGFANIVNLFDPELITVGGAIALKNRELILNPIVKHVRDYTVNRVPEIKITPLGESVVLYGAIALAIKPPKVLKRRELL